MTWYCFQSHDDGYKPWPKHAHEGLPLSVWYGSLTVHPTDFHPHSAPAELVGL